MIMVITIPYQKFGWLKKTPSAQNYHLLTK